MAIHNIFPEPPITIWIDKQKPGQLKEELPQYAEGNWKHIHGLHFQYGKLATLYIPYTENSWRDLFIQFGNSTTVRPVGKEFLSADEINTVVDSFLNDVLLPYRQDHPELKVMKEGKEL